MIGNRRVTVTGGAGFIGSHLVSSLVDDGFEVLVIDDLSTGHSAGIPDRVRLEVVDICAASIRPLIRGWAPRVVYHLAAQTSVPMSMRRPAHDLRVNGTGTRNVAWAAFNAEVERFVHVSSGGAVYGETPVPASESILPNPTSFYGMHKLLGELYVKGSGLSYAILRPSNVYGPRQQPGFDGAVVASFVDAIAAGRALRVDGDGEQVRDFVHVNDVVTALRLLAEAPVSGTWNVSGGTAVSVNALVQLLGQAARRGLATVAAPARAGDVRTSRLDCSNLEARGWSPSVTLESGLRDLLMPTSRRLGR